MPARRAATVDQAAAALISGRSVVLVGERGSGRTTHARQVAAATGQALMRGTALRLVARPGLPLAMALRDDGTAVAPGAGELLLVEDLQWADGDTVEALRHLVRPALLTCTPGAEVLDAIPADQLALLPLDDDEAAALLGEQSTTTARLRRAGGNARLLRALTPGTPPRGPALRTALSLLADLDDGQRELALLLGAARTALPLTGPAVDALLATGALVPDGSGVRLRIGVVGELEVSRTDAEALAAAHRRVAGLVDGPAAAAPHLLAAGDHVAAREAALDAVSGGELDPGATADLLLLAVGGDPPARLTDDLADLLAECLWQTWRLDELLHHVKQPTAPVQRRVVMLARTVRGDAVTTTGPPGAQARADLAAGRLGAALPADDLDAALAAAGAALAGEGGDTRVRGDVSEGDGEQRWQAGALAVVTVWLEGQDTGPALDSLTAQVRDAPSPRWSALAELLREIVRSQVDGASAATAERLTAALADVPAPVPAWAVAALALVHADLGAATDAERVLASASPTSALDRQLLMLVRAECELTTGRPRMALRALADVELWPALARYGDVLAACARVTVAQTPPDPRSSTAPTTRAARAAAAELAATSSQDPAAFATAAELWRGVSARRGLHCRWSAAEARRRGGAPDVDELRALEQVALDTDLLPLLARVRETLRRTGVRSVRTASTVTGTAGLSPREVEVLGLVREGLTSAQAATRLGVAQSTVETQVASAMRKLGARTRRHAVALLDGATA